MKEVGSEDRSEMKNLTFSPRKPPKAHRCQAGLLLEPDLGNKEKSQT